MASEVGELWMGSVERYMDENYIRNCFSLMGEVISRVKMMKNKFTGEPAGYCFVQFPNEFSALIAMHRLNNKWMPGSQPPTRFRLNHTWSGGKAASNKDLSLWVAELSPDVDDYILYKGFASRYPSVRLAKVIFDACGQSRGYGFVKFMDHNEHKDALVKMNGFQGIGSKALRVNIAIRPAECLMANNPLQGQSMATVQVQSMWSGGQAQPGGPGNSQYYQHYEQYYAVLQNYGTQHSASYAYAQQEPPQQAQTGQGPHYPGGMSGWAVPHYQHGGGQQQVIEFAEHSNPVDVSRPNSEARAISNTDVALEDPRWVPMEIGD